MNSDTHTIPAWLANARSFRRSRSDRTIAGVAGGLAPRLGLSPVAARLGFVILGLATIGLPLYLAALIAIRSQGDARPVGSLRLVAAIAVALGTWVISLSLLPFGISGLMVVAALIGVGTLLLFGRSRRPESAPTVVNVGARPAPMAPPTLFLLALGLAVIAAAGVWFFTLRSGDVQAFGAAGAAALVVIGLAQMLGAWRGRSALLVPLGLGLVIPLGMAAVVDSRLDLGFDDPGVIGALSDSGDPLTFVLGSGSGPVTVSRDAFASGLRSLTIRKPIGRIDLRIAPGIPVQLEVHTAFHRGEFSPSLSDRVYGVRRVLARTGREINLPGAGANAAAEPLKIRIDGGFGRVFISRATGSFQAVVPRRVLLQDARVNLTARRALLVRETAGLRSLRARYSRALGSSIAVSGLPSAVSKTILAINEGDWYAKSLDDPDLRAGDPALDRLTAVQRRVEKAQRLRFDILRAEWRVNSIRTAIPAQERRIAQLVKGATP